ncbi:cytochrome c [Myxococcota bacterium]|nr:cytochrome c [Myxococcota bacterium]
MIRTISIFTLLTALPATALAADVRTSVGDWVNGKKLYDKECAACHGDDGKGGRSGVSLTDSGRMNLITNELMFAQLREGAGLKKPKEHSFGGPKLQFLDLWDVVAYTRTLHMGIDEFFPAASRYVSKVYTIDEHGLGRIEKVTGKALADKAAAVFTFFNFPGEEGRLQYVPQDPIRLDQLKKPMKSGYLVFLPFKTEGFEGELGLGMDKDGKLTALFVHSGHASAELLNKSLSRFVGMGRKGTKEPFKIGGGKVMDTLAADLFPAYLRAMETVTMYDREENERTWADE